MNPIEIAELELYRHVAFAIGHDMSAPLSDMQGVHFREPHMAVDAAATVPTTVWLVTVIDLHGNDIVSLQVRRKLIAKRTIAVRTRAEPMSIDPHSGVHVSAVKIDEELFTGFNIRLEMFAVPSYPTGQGTPARPRRVVHGEITFDSPVVREIKQTPTAVIDILLIQSSVRRIEQEAPAIIKKPVFTGPKTHDTG